MKMTFIKNEVLHNKDCPYLILQGDNEMELEELIEWGKRYRCCKRCQRIVLIHDAIANSGDYEKYYNFFDRHQVSPDTLKRLFVIRKAKVIIVDDFVEVECGEDIWRIPLRQGSGKVDLWHNNYIRNLRGERRICDGFHEQKHSNKTVEGV